MLNLVANGSSGYNLTNSLRFRSSASAYLNRTPTTPTNSYIWTYSAWFKRGTLGVAQTLLEAWAANNNTQYGAITITSSDTLTVSGWTLAWRTTTQVFRDPSAWYHLVVAVDTTQATGANRVKVYINGNQVTAFGTSNDPTQNTTTGINTAIAHSIGSEYSGTRYQYFDGYLTEVNFIDGQALTPSSFGNTNATTGVWQPAKYTGTYGTNGFYLNFNSIALTSGSNTGLGKDNSGNGNYWNTNNISVTAGATYDAMVDVPTLTSTTVANYPVFNPLDNSGATLTGANLNYTMGTRLRGTMPTGSTGKWYFEFICQSGVGSSTPQSWGLGTLDGSLTTPKNYIYAYINGLVRAGGDCFCQFVVNGTANPYVEMGITTASVGDAMQIAYDADTGKVWFGINNVWSDASRGTTGNPSAGTNPTLTITAGLQLTPFLLYTATSYSGSLNCGQRPFAYTPPTGYLALNTYNLPTPTILQGNKYMDATLYTGNGSTQTITNAAGFKPDFVWVGIRNTTNYNHVENSVVGATKYLNTNSTGAESTFAGAITSFNSNGFSVGNGAEVNINGSTFVGWQWQAGQGSTSSNTSGSITSTVSVNATAGFSVVTYTGTGANATVGHGLGVAPKMVIVKDRTNGTNDWSVYHTSLGNTAYIFLNLTNASSTTNGNLYWNNTSPTSTVFSVGTTGRVNASSDNYVAYCWAEIAGFSKFGSYTGNGSTDGPFIYLGFRPKYIMRKETSGVGDWIIFDNARNPYNVESTRLLANTGNGDQSPGNDIDVLSNGWKERNSDGYSNNSGSTYIYMAFAESPFKSSLAR